jgi:acetyltransferase-like isoleucine patch superfamily enzyme
MIKNLCVVLGSICDTPWKGINELRRWLCYPFVRTLFLVYAIRWRKGWKLYGMPILQKHRKSTLKIGDYLQLRSYRSSNPLGPTHPVTLCTWKSEAILTIGDRFSMTGGAICAAKKITIGNSVRIGANTTVIDTDFHSLDPVTRKINSYIAKAAPIIIDDEVFIGMNSLILKGVTLGRGCTVGAGSVVTRDVPEYALVAGNPAKIIF